MQSCYHTCTQYFSDTLVLFLAGLVIALAIEYSNLDKRIALGTILCIGCSPRRYPGRLYKVFTLNLSFSFRLHFGLTFCTIGISLWISNSAAAAMMCPIIKAVVSEMHSVSMPSITIGESSMSSSKSVFHIAEQSFRCLYVPGRRTSRARRVSSSNTLVEGILILVRKLKLVSLFCFSYC